MVVRRRKIKIGGKEIELDVFDTKLVPGSGKEEDSVSQLLKEEEIEKVIRNALKKIEIISKRYSNKKKNLKFYYEVGKILQFVDKEKYGSRLLIWERMVHNLRANLFDINLDHFKYEKIAKREAKRRADVMYHIGKQLEADLKKATWDQWYEIVKFKTPDKSKWLYEDKNLLKQVLSECKKNLSGPQLRNRIEEVRDKFKRKD